MPHLRLEYSSNIRQEIDPKVLFGSCHQVLVKTVNADLFRCQSRVIRCELYHVGDGSLNEAFIYLEIALLEGRSLDKLQIMEKEILKVLESYFVESIKELNIQIAVRVVEIVANQYVKLESHAK